MDEKKMQKRFSLPTLSYRVLFHNNHSVGAKEVSGDTQNDLDFCGRIKRSILITEWREIAFTRVGGCIGLDNHSRIGNDWQIVKMIFDAL